MTVSSSTSFTTVFTTLHGMPAQTSHENAVCIIDNVIIVQRARKIWYWLFILLSHVDM